MRVQAWFCEPDDGGCVTYPVEITDEHPRCSYGQPIVIIDGEPCGPSDLPLGELQIPADVYDELADRLRVFGYPVCDRAVDADWLECWEAGEPVDHWHPEARLVYF